MASLPGLRAFRTTSLLRLFIATNVFLWSFSTLAEDWVGCMNEGPLVSGTWPEAQTTGWDLPVSVFHPDLITAARLRAELVRNGVTGTWHLVLQFSFPDPKPYGIPFSFDRVRLTWDGPHAPGSVDLDWSDGCSSPGRSLFPGQSWSAGIDLPETDGHCALENPTLYLWGSRN